MGNHQPGKNGSPPDPQTVPFLVDFGTGDEFLNKWVELAHEYGSVFSVKMEGRWVVFVTGWEAAREVLVKTELDFADKPRYPSSEVHNLEYKGKKGSHKLNNNCKFNEIILKLIEMAPSCAQAYY